MNKWKASLVCDFGIREIYIKKEGKLIKAEGESPEELRKQLRENFSHLIALVDEDNVQHTLGFPVWPFQDEIIIYTHFTMESSNQKGTTV